MKIKKKEKSGKKMQKRFSRYFFPIKHSIVCYEFVVHAVICTRIIVFVLSTFYRRFSGLGEKIPWMSLGFPKK
jgi:hypothetical protein